MIKKLQEEIEALKAKAKAPDNQDVKFNVASGDEESTSLNKVIKTKEQADTFMKILRAI